MKRWEIFCFILLILPLFVSADNGCCINPYQDVCVEVDSSVCCPKDSVAFTLEGLAIDYNYCSNNYFIKGSNCLDIENDACVKGCCCIVEGTDTKVYSARTEYKAGCNGDLKQWLGLTDCSQKGCRDYFDSLKDETDIVKDDSLALIKSNADSSTKGKIIAAASCREGEEDPSKEFECRFWNLEPNKNIWRWCNLRSCATQSGCRIKYDAIDFKGKTFVCKINIWKEVISTEELASESIPLIEKVD
jgi:hypothetical protein